MFFKGKRRFIAFFTALVVMIINCGSAVSAEGTFNSKKTAYLDYDAKYGTYSLVTENGEVTDSEFYINVKKVKTAENEEQDSTEAATEQPAVTTTAPQTTQPAVTTAAPITGVVQFTTIVTKYVSPAGTVADYVGRYRVDKLTELESYLNGYTTTTTTTTTTVTKKVYDGIDVSRHQGLINWKKVKDSGIDFVMIRAGYGMEDDQVDANFHANIRAAQKLGIECGVYWYSYALNENEALREAKLCYNTIKDYTLTYPVSFDIEDPSQKSLSKTEISNITKTFCDYLESKNYYVSVYSYASMLNDKMNSNVIGKYDIWVAHTNVSKPSFKSDYGMWQYSWEGSVSGITGDVDLDYGYKNYPEIIKKGNFSGN